MINTILYNTLALGGTFDHLHDGHKEFLEFAAAISKSLLIGVTDQQMTLQKPYSELIQPTHVRKQAVLNFCGQHNITAKVITIFDPFGPTIEENKIEAIACTTDTITGANKINDIRSKLHLKQLPIHIHTLKKDSLGQKAISAERIRAGEIDRKGTVYKSLFTKNLQLDQTMRKFFAEPHGKLITQPGITKTDTSLRIIVGDSTLEKFVTNKWSYELGIFDRKRKRVEYQSSILDSLNAVERASNKPGYIETSAVEAVQEWKTVFQEKGKTSKEYKHIFIDGEEDLLAVVAVLLLPLGSTIYYGQPNQGMIECIVTENLKESFYSVLAQK